MASAPTTVLALACFMLAGQKQTSGREYPIRMQEVDIKPEISAIPDQNLILGENVTFLCQGPRGGLTFILTKDGNVTHEQHRAGPRAEFHIAGVQEGEYACLYKPGSDSSPSSEPSDPLDITVREHYPEPTIVVKPHRVIRRGTDLDIVCSGRRPNMRFILYKNKEISQQKDPAGKEAEFHIAGATEKDEGQYICYYCTRPGIPEVCSEGSEPIVINVTDLSKPQISFEKDPDLEGWFSIHCSAPEKHRGSWFSLYSAEGLVEEGKAEAHTVQVTFSVNHSDVEYWCMYQIRVAGDLADSPLSDLVAVGNDYTWSNYMRLLLAALVLILTVLIIAEDCHSRKVERQAEARPRRNWAQDEDFQQRLEIDDSV